MSYLILFFFNHVRSISLPAQLFLSNWLLEKIENRNNKKNLSHLCRGCSWLAWQRAQGPVQLEVVDVMTKCCGGPNCDISKEICKEGNHIRHQLKELKLYFHILGFADEVIYEDQSWPELVEGKVCAMLLRQIQALPLGQVRCMFLLIIHV